MLITKKTTVIACGLRKRLPPPPWIMTIVSLLLSILPVVASDLDLIINEINSIDKKLSKIIENEATQRKASDNMILAKIGKTGPATSGIVDSVLLARIAGIEKNVERTRTIDDSTAVRIAGLSHRIDSIFALGANVEIIELAEMLKKLLADLKQYSASVSRDPPKKEVAKNVEKPTIDVGGLIYVHYTADVSKSPSLDNDGFSIERAYIDLKAKISERISGRLTYDLDPKDSTYKDMYLKFAYADYAVGGGFNLRAGQQEEYWGGNVDKAWKYRSIERSMSDINKIIPSADIGLAALYKLPNGYGDAVVQVINGNGFKNTKAREETNFQKDITARVSVRPVQDSGAWKGLSLHAGFQYKNDVLFPYEALSGLIAFENNFVSLGCELLGVIKKDSIDRSNSMKTLGYSIFGDIPMPFHKKAGILFRYDFFDPDKSIDKDGNALLIAGTRYAISPKHTLAIVFYQQTKEKPGSQSLDLIKAVLEAKF
jgi:hypothetical protein